MEYTIFDIETDGLIENVTKIHCCSTQRFRDGQLISRRTFTNYSEMREFFTNQQLNLGTIIGHNIVRYDIPVLELILKIKIECRLIDTLGLSWYAYPERETHNLEDWGEDLGVEKPPIADWKNLTVEEYINRCQQDVLINTLLFDKIIHYLQVLYQGQDLSRLINYLMFKLDCAREQEEIKWRVDVEQGTKNIEVLNTEETFKIEALKEVMPFRKIYKIVSKPKNCFKKDGSTSEIGKRWFTLLEEHKLPDYHNGAIKVLAEEEQGNPGSHQQLKDWLFSLGWEPETFKYVREEGPDKYNNPVRAIPQISLLDGSDICYSVKALYEKESQLKHLESLFVIRHRRSLIEGMLKRTSQEGFIKAEIKGFTNTLRFQHTGVVNLPTIMKPYGKLVRGILLTPDDNHVLCGSDISGLEEGTKHHYMYYYDPKYVLEMRQPGFDPHLDIAVLAGLMSKDGADFFKYLKAIKDGKEVDNSGVSAILLQQSDEEQKAIYKELAKIRDTSKKTNFAATYGAGAAKIALTAKITIELAKLLHKIYWKRNAAVKKVVGDVTRKTLTDLNGTQQMWLWNPVSCFWYSLRYEKDIFSTLNQGTGAYCFDMWVKKNRSKGLKLCGQFHDELISPILKGDEERVSKILKDSIDETNKELNLNIKLGISIDFGQNYSEIH